MAVRIARPRLHLKPTAPVCDGDLLAILEADAREKLTSSVAAGDLLLADTLRLVNVQEATYAPNSGQPGDTLSLTMSAVYGAQYIRADDARRFAEAGLNSSIPAGFRPIPDTLAIHLAKTVQSDTNGSSRITLELRRTIAQIIDPVKAEALVRGLSPVAAGDRLQAQLPLARRPEVKLVPKWWPWLPLIPFRIAVITP